MSKEEVGGEHVPSTPSIILELTSGLKNRFTLNIGLSDEICCMETSNLVIATHVHGSELRCITKTMSMCMLSSDCTHGIFIFGEVSR